MRKSIALTCITVMIATLLFGCGTTPRTSETPSPLVIEDTSPTQADPDSPLITTPGDSHPEPAIVNPAPAGAEYMNDGYHYFAVNLLNQTAAKDTNVLISPASVCFAMSMAAMGAQGNTYDEMAALFGNGLAKDDLTAFFSSMAERLGGDELSIANSVWINKDSLATYGVETNRDFLNLLRTSYRAEAEERSFNAKTLKDINSWVKKNTHNMIPSILSELDPDDLMLLINAIAFEDKWQTPYESYDIDENGVFTNSRGQKETCKMMHSTEYTYLAGHNATGFRKDYKGGKYSFVAMLPDDPDISLEEFLAGLDGKDFADFVSDASAEKVLTYMPAFSFDYEILLNTPLQKLGVHDAFVPGTADFSGMVENMPDDYIIWISRVIHKTHIEVDEQGTKAAAVTVIEVKNCTTAIEIEMPKIVRLDRPFVFGIVEKETGLPIFLGTVNSITD